MAVFSGKTILIAPLDWGLGHATRCVPLIRQLSESNRVIVGVTDLNRDFFRQHFPQLQHVELPSYRIRYSSTWPAWLKILQQFPTIKKVIQNEQQLLDQLVKDLQLEVVISDNRFGLYNAATRNVFITHQLNVRSPFFMNLAGKINRSYIHRFNEVWVPDHENANQRLSGWLSDRSGIHIPVKYIGPQSALQHLTDHRLPQKKTDYLLLLSGPEPQRTLLEKQLVERFRATKQHIVLVRGSKTAKSLQAGNVSVIDLASGAQLRRLILSAETILCRSGYSTLMDLHLMGKKNLILVPTPGQTEQEYLAEHWERQFGARRLLQRHVKDFTP